MDIGKDNKTNIYVAIIDENPQLRDISVKQLENSGYTVLFQTGNGQDALQKLKEDDREPDVCIIEEDFATAKLLLKNHPDLKVLISSAEDNEESVTDMLKIGVSGYILKYAEPDEMIVAISAIYSRKYYFSIGVSEFGKKYILDNRNLNI